MPDVAAAFADCLLVCRSEESKLEEYIKGIADSGAKVRDTASYSGGRRRHLGAHSQVQELQETGVHYDDAATGSPSDTCAAADACIRN